MKTTRGLWKQTLKRTDQTIISRFSKPNGRIRALLGQNNLTFHHFNQITVLKIVRVQSPPSYMSRLLALISHILSTTSWFAYTSWPTGSFDWFVLGSGSLFFFIILISPLLLPLKNLKQSTVSLTNFYRHYKTIFWDKCARSRLWWQ